MSFFNIDLSGNRIKVHQYGSGRQLLVAFHGFDESGMDYELLEPVLGENYTIAVPDLPFHGESEWENGLLTEDRLAGLVRMIMKKVGADRCSVMGYSMGGRLAIYLCRQLRAKVVRLLLLAPEGLRKNPWLHIATGSFVGRWMFGFFIRHPQAVIALARFAGNLGWISKSMTAYVEKLMKEPSSRLRVYNTWMCFRKLNSIDHRAPFKEMHFPVRLWFGRYDRVIPPPGKRERQRWSPATISIISTGHLLFGHEQSLKEVYAFLCDFSKHK